MNEENKCNGLDCAICAETNCPNEKKEIIIDGCNVAEYEYVDLKSLPIDCPINNGFCYEFTCYFKQLKRLQKENEELKQEINKYKQALEEIRSYCDEQNLKADYTDCYITNRIDEVLNDRD